MPQSPPNLSPQSSSLSPSDAFLLAATPDPDSDHRAGTPSSAAEILAANPNLPNENFYAACVLADRDALFQHLRKSPALASTPGGPHNWPPLCYLTFSKFLRLEPPASLKFAFAAALLLVNHADPNSYWSPPSQPNEKETALYGAAGLANNAPLTRNLLVWDADPNDPEALYHASEFTDNTVLEILLTTFHAKRIDPQLLSYCMCHKMDIEDPAGLQLFLTHGADPNFLIDRGQRQGDRPLHFALTRHRSDAILSLLLHHHANHALTDAKSQTPHQLALKLGRPQTALLLRHHGAPDDSTPKLHLLAALSSANEKAALNLLTPPHSVLSPQHSVLSPQHSVLASLTPDDQTILIDAAAQGHTEAAALMLSPPFNFNIEIRKPPAEAWDGTPLHHACYFAHPQTVQLLLQHHANPHALHAYGGNALTTTIHAATHSKTLQTDLPLHLQTLTLLAPYFPKQSLQQSLTHLNPTTHPELTTHLQSLFAFARPST